MKAWFRGIAAMFSSEATAAISVLSLTIYTGLSFDILVHFNLFQLFLSAGFTIPKPPMISALRWITYINVNFIFLSSFLLRVCLTFYFILASER
jgi:ATP-binding cassette subfamily G (WHITE) protein 2 (SNQ2)